MFPPASKLVALTDILTRTFWGQLIGHQLKAAILQVFVSSRCSKLLIQILSSQCLKRTAEFQAKSPLQRLNCITELLLTLRLRQPFSKVVQAILRGIEATRKQGLKSGLGQVIREAINANVN